MYSESACPDVYIDLDEEGSAVLYHRDLSAQGQERFRELFGSGLKFAVKSEFPNMRAHKPSFFSAALKSKFRD